MIEFGKRVERRHTVRPNNRRRAEFWNAEIHWRIWLPCVLGLLMCGGAIVHRVRENLEVPAVTAEKK